MKYISILFVTCYISSAFGGGKPPEMKDCEKLDTAKNGVKCRGTGHYGYNVIRVDIEKPSSQLSQDEKDTIAKIQDAFVARVNRSEQYIFIETTAESRANQAAKRCFKQNINRPVSCFGVPLSEVENPDQIYKAFHQN